MSINKTDLEIFGQVKDGPDSGQSVYRVQLKGGGLTANVLTYGAVLQDLRIDGHDDPLVLGFTNFEDYENHSPYFGATAGRFANRIGNGSFEIDDTVHQSHKNFLDKHTLHGGRFGTGKRLWTIADLGTSHVYLTNEEPDGFMGFPGDCRMTCDITLKEDGILHVAYSMRSTKATPASLAHHSYFTLDGGRDCRDTILSIAAEHYLPVDEEMIPTGVVAPVADTAFDFQQAKPIGQDLDQAEIYDHNFCLSETRRGLQIVCQVDCPQTKLTLEVSTTEPGLQFYAAHKLSTPVNGLNGAPYGAFSGFCLETQNWPDAPNHASFPNAILQPGDELRQVTEYKFTKG